MSLKAADNGSTASLPSADGCVGMSRATPASEEAIRSTAFASAAGATICNAPGAPASSDAEGFTQHGWTVRYGARDARGRPLRIDAECDAGCGGPQTGSQSGPLSVRLIIDQWLEP